MRFDEDDIYHFRALVLGPVDTPYEHGYFFFDMHFSKDYPFKPPKAKFMTNDGRVRFNPNLYSTGKVCLSILGTWRAEHSGEQWSAVQSVQSILMSIQSLMNDTPYHNEPSFEEDDGSGDVQKYNEKIAHETLRVGVCEVMEETLMLRAQSSNGVCPLFAATRRVLFLMYYERYLADSRALCDKKECRDGQPFKMMPFECSSNGMHGQFQWGQVRGRLEKIHAALLASIDEWKRKGAEQTAQLKAKQDSQVTACIHHLHQQVERIKHEMPASVSIGGASSARALCSSAPLSTPGTGSEKYNVRVRAEGAERATHSSAPNAGTTAGHAEARSSSTDAGIWGGSPSSAT